MDASTSKSPPPTGRAMTARSALIIFWSSVSLGAVPEQIGQARANGPAIRASQEIATQATVAIRLRSPLGPLREDPKPRIIVAPC